MTAKGAGEVVGEEGYPHLFAGGVLRTFGVASPSNRYLTVHLHASEPRQSRVEAAK